MRRKHQLRKNCIVCGHAYDEEHRRVPKRYPCRKCYREQQRKYTHTLVQMKNSRDRIRACNHLQVVAFKVFWKMKHKHVRTGKLYDQHMAFVESICSTCDDAYNNLSGHRLELLKQWEQEYLA